MNKSERERVTYLTVMTCTVILSQCDREINKQHYDRGINEFERFETMKTPAVVAEWVKPLAAVHAGQGSLPVRVEARLLPLRVIGLSAGVHAIGLFLDRHRGFTCVLFKM